MQIRSVGVVGKHRFSGLVAFSIIHTKKRKARSQEICVALGGLGSVVKSSERSINKPARAHLAQAADPIQAAVGCTFWPWDAAGAGSCVRPASLCVVVPRELLHVWRSLVVKGPRERVGCGLCALSILQ